MWPQEQKPVKSEAKFPRYANGFGASKFDINGVYY